MEVVSNRALNAGSLPVEQTIQPGIPDRSQERVGAEVEHSTLTHNPQNEGGTNQDVWTPFNWNNSYHRGRRTYSNSNRRGRPFHNGHRSRGSYNNNSSRNRSRWLRGQTFQNGRGTHSNFRNDDRYVQMNFNRHNNQAYPRQTTQHRQHYQSNFPQGQYQPQPDETQQDWRQAYRHEPHAHSQDRPQYWRGQRPLESDHVVSRLDSSEGQLQELQSREIVIESQPQQLEQEQEPPKSKAILKRSQPSSEQIVEALAILKLEYGQPPQKESVEPITLNSMHVSKSPITQQMVAQKQFNGTEVKQQDSMELKREKEMEQETSLNKAMQDLLHHEKGPGVEKQGSILAQGDEKESQGTVLQMAERRQLYDKHSEKSGKPVTVESQVKGKEEVQQPKLREGKDCQMADTQLSKINLDPSNENYSSKTSNTKIPLSDIITSVTSEPQHDDMNKSSCNSVTDPEKVSDVCKVKNKVPRKSVAVNIRETASKKIDDMKVNGQIYGTSLVVESMYLLLMDVEQLLFLIHRINSQSFDDGIAKIMEKLHDMLISSESDFVKYMSIPKGKRLVLGVMKYCKNTDAIIDCIFDNIGKIARNDTVCNSCMLPLFLPHFRLRILEMDMHSLIRFKQHLLSGIRLFFWNKVGITLLSCMIERAEDIFDELDDKKKRIEWLNFVQYMVETIRTDQVFKISDLRIEKGKVQKHLERCLFLNESSRTKFLKAF